ncbi:SOS response-associated peptidase [Dyadobacter frigoris]|uniref:Abasic site processing protein n=1 Tax=Dyadobacter frigoris TaxID=2576211 RepID=A0A4U6CKI0_9BACT|nr:SOS response-associated peptidase family protein [Dyadobacter frigoris]TKT84720.1 SOS response-associated peptidase [Dyadobacter frigoris]
MCYHISNEDDAALREFGLPIQKLEKFKKKYDMNGFEKPYIPVISNKDPKSIDMYRWRLVPSWVKEEKDWKANTLNARNDELFTKTSYKNYWRNRCLVICTGFFEPHYPKDSKEYESWYIKPKERRCFTLGGIYSVWQNEPTVSIITTDASPLMAKVHNDGERQPLILEGDAALAWLVPDLTEEEMKNLMLYQYPDEKLDTYRVMDGIYSTKIDTNKPAAITPYVRPPFDALTLFDL